MLQGTEMLASSAPVTDAGTWKSRLTPGGTITCPFCAERQLLATASNAPISSEERVALSEAINGWFDHLLQAQRQVGGVIPPRREAAMLATGDPPALPPHMTPLGEQRQLVAGHGRAGLGAQGQHPRN